MRSSNSPRYFAPATSAPRSKLNTLQFKVLGTSLLAILIHNPSTIAVLPVPGGPIKTALFLDFRQRISIILLISFNLPITGSSFPCSANAVISIAYFLSAS
eukprot:NODE_500_length_6721_cov_0.845492.p6 type:complete len:101 gc:universal NODE_500_length_6721_cov_0.845492:2104-2406(+)